MRTPVLAIALVLAGVLRAGAEDRSDPLRDLILRSLRAGEAAGVEAATGGLARLGSIGLELTVQPGTRTIQGHARLEWPNTTGRTIDELPVRISANDDETAPRITFENVEVGVLGSQNAKVATRPGPGGALWITLPVPVAAGERVVVSGTLRGTMDRLRKGATDPVASSLGALFGGGDGDGDYGTFACGDGICTATGFAPDVPAWIDGRFDVSAPSGIGDATFSEPRNVLLSVVAPSKVRVAATGFEVGRVSAGRGLARTSFAMAAAREVGLALSDRYVVETAEVGGVRVRSFSLEEHREAGKRALEAATSTLHALDTRIGRYPWAQLDIAESALVGGAGGVELPGLALGASGFYGAQGLMAQADPSGALSKAMLEFVTRHEVAHQWWHAQVGSHSQQHPYVDEPLAQWSAVIATRAVSGKAAAKAARDLQLALNFQALSLLGVPDGPVARPAGGYASTIEYAGLVYGKAPLFYEAAERLIGARAVEAALRRLVVRRRFSRATPEDVRAALRDEAGEKAAALDALWTRWFEEAHGAEDVGRITAASMLGLSGGLHPSGLPPDLVSPENLKQLDEAMKLLDGFLRDSP